MSKFLNRSTYFYLKSKNNIPKSHCRNRHYLKFQKEHVFNNNKLIYNSIYMYILVIKIQAKKKKYKYSIMCKLSSGYSMIYCQKNINHPVIWHKNQKSKHLIIREYNQTILNIKYFSFSNPNNYITKSIFFVI